MSEKAICAVATPIGSSALGIVRVSGDNLLKKISFLFKKQLKDRTATYTAINDGDKMIDSCVAIFYKAPKSYTGEDMIEIICHGNHIIIKSIINTLLKNGISQAGPGEFTKRAFFNNKINLLQAEAVADLINASSEQSVKAANNSLSGKFAEEIKYIQNLLLELRALIESIINFPEDEDVPEVNINESKNKLQYIIQSLDKLISISTDGKSLNHRLSYIVVGKPNSGKSSLINSLLREDASIVTNIEGTTRDSIQYSLCIDNLIINLIDTAGIRKTDDLIEQAGIDKTISMISKSDKILYMIDDNMGITKDDEDFLKQYPHHCHIIFNKIDVSGKEASVTINDITEIYLSAKNNDGIDLLKDVIRKDCAKLDCSENVFLARERHIVILKKVYEHLNKSQVLLSGDDLDLCAEELRLSHLALSSILGQNSTEDLLDKIFSSFCIGK